MEATFVSYSVNASDKSSAVRSKASGVENTDTSSSTPHFSGRVSDGIQCSEDTPGLHDNSTVDSQGPLEVPAELLVEDKDDVEADWLVPAVLSAIFCFLPTGIIAVIHARKARKARELDDSAHDHHRGRARIYVLLSLLLGVILYAVLIGVIQSVTKSEDGS